MTEHVLRHMGFTDDQIAALSAPFDHRAHGCDFDSNHMGWVCEDEDGKPYHGDYDAMSVVAETIGVALETPALHCARCANIAAPLRGKEGKVARPD